eukprot:Skav225395  [mRNA]  locus=scaffold2656:258373:262746:+ [translate_table: standard]
MDIPGIDDFGALLSDVKAFQSGLRVSLKAVDIQGGRVIAQTTTKAFPIPQWIDKFLKVEDEFTVVDFRFQQLEAEFVIDGKGHAILPIIHLGSIRDSPALEAYAGIGGWGHGARLCGLETCLYIESCPSTAMSCAKTLNVDVLTMEDALRRCAQDDLPNKLVLVGDCNSKEAMFFAGVFRTATWLISPPCQPWSTAGTLKGFTCAEGQAFGKTLIAATITKASAILAENVPGFPKHRHYEKFRSLLQVLGWWMPVAAEDKLLPLLPISRSRWLAVILPSTRACDRTKIDIAKNVSIPNEVPGIGKQTSIGFADTVQTEIHEWELKQSLPPDEAIQLMSMFNLLPQKAQKQIGQGGVSWPPEDVLALRVKSTRQFLPNAMAMMGSQHTLPIEHLREKGLHAYLIGGGCHRRFPLPFEVSSALGFSQDLVLPTDYHDAWMITGNALAVPHAALACFRLHVLLGDDSPFDCKWLSVFDLCKDCRMVMTPMDDLHVDHDDGWMWLVPKCHKTCIDPTGSPEGQQDVSRVFTPEMRDDLVAKPSPTMTYLVDDEPTREVKRLSKEDIANIHPTALVSDRPPLGSLLEREVVLEPVELFGAESVNKIKHRDGCHVATLIHDQGNWCGAAWRLNGEPIRDTIRQCLPHAIADMFEIICLGGTEITFLSIPEHVGACDIFLTPRYFLRLVEAPFLLQPMAVRVDVTWTFGDLLAFVATELAMIPSAVIILHQKLVMPWDRFVLSVEATTFQLDFRMPKLTIHNLVYNEMHPKAGSPVIEFEPDLPSLQLPDKFANIMDVRFATRDPRTGSVRSIMCTSTTTVRDMLALLLPGISDTCELFVSNDNSTFLPDDHVGVLCGRGVIEIHFPSAKAIPNELLDVIPIHARDMEQRNHSMKAIEVKGPFDFRSSSKMYPENASLCHVASAFLVNTKCNLTLMILKGGKLLDPRMLVKDIEHTDILHFRACALPGGAKQDDAMKGLKDLLISKGVPKEDVGERAKLVWTKLPQAEIRTLLTKEEPYRWTEFKNLANKAHVRLVTTNELKLHQKAMRATKPMQGSQMSKAKKSKGFDAKNLVLDLSHFKAGTERVNALELSHFGPDAKGTGELQNGIQTLANQQNTIQQQIASSNTAVVTQMQALFKQINTRFDELDAEKRPRKDNEL